MPVVPLPATGKDQSAKSSLLLRQAYKNRMPSPPRVMNKLVQPPQKQPSDKIRTRSLFSQFQKKPHPNNALVSKSLDKTVERPIKLSAAQAGRSSTPDNKVTKGPGQAPKCRSRNTSPKTNMVEHFLDCNELVQSSKSKKNKTEDKRGDHIAVKNLEVENVVLNNELNVVNREVLQLVERLRSSDNENQCLEKYLKLMEAKDNGNDAQKQWEEVFKQKLEEEVDTLKQTKTKLEEKIRYLELNREEEKAEFFDIQDKLRKTQCAAQDLQMALGKSINEYHNLENDYRGYKTKMKNLLAMKDIEIKAMRESRNLADDSKNLEEHLSDLKKERDELLETATQLRKECKNTKLMIDQLVIRSGKAERLYMNLKNSLKYDTSDKNASKHDFTKKNITCMLTETGPQSSKLQSIYLYKDTHGRELSSRSLDSITTGDLNVADYSKNMTDPEVNHHLSRTLTQKQKTIDKLLTENSGLKKAIENITSKRNAGIQLSSSVTEKNRINALRLVACFLHKLIDDIVSKYFSNLTTGSIMVRHYQRTTNRGEWDNKIMEQAVQDVSTGKLSCKRASTTYNLPRSTLQRKIKEFANKQTIQPKQLGFFKPVFTSAQEEELAAYIKDMESRFFGLSPKEVRELAFQLAEINGIPHNFDRNTRAAGEDWLVNFMKRNATLSLRKPEPTSAARAMGFNREAVGSFFKLLTEIVEKYVITSDRLFNVDETGMTTVAKSLGKVVATKGRKQVGSLSSAERGQLFTVEICMSASGSFMAPMFIFPRQRMKAELMDGAPPNSWAECNEKGWITHEIFAKWFQKFVAWSKATKDLPVLLLLDGHSSHVKSLEVINFARDNGVHIICFPPHCTHRLQPLDVSFMKPLSVYYGEEVKKWLRHNPGRVVTHYQVSHLFGNAFLKAATMLVAINGFRRTGIWPVNPDIFDDHDFLAADTTDLPMPIVQPDITESTNKSPPITPSRNQTASRIFGPETLTNTSPSLTLDKASSLDREPPKTPPPGPSSSFHVLSPENVMPVPKARVQKRVTRKRGKTAVITSSPYKTELEQSKQVTPREKKGKMIPKKKKKDAGNKENETDDEDVECLYCGDWYSQSQEGWVSCRACKRWAHCSCAGEDDNDDESLHICSYCSRF